MDLTLFYLAQALPASPGTTLLPGGNVVPEGIYDIIVPEAERPLWPLFVFGFLGLILLGAIVWLILFLMRQREPRLSVSLAGRTFREFNRIEQNSEDLPNNARALAISEALKNYFEERFRDRVRYETTEEFLARLSREGTRLPHGIQEGLREFLTASEEVKFGNRRDASTWITPLVKSARDLVTSCEAFIADQSPSRRQATKFRPSSPTGK